MRFVIAIVILLICAFIAAKLADGKGRNPWLWGLIGFIFGLIGVVVAAIVPSRRGDADSAALG